MPEVAFCFVSPASCIYLESYVPLLFQSLYDYGSSTSIFNLLENAVPCCQGVWHECCNTMVS